MQSTSDLRPSTSGMSPRDALLGFLPLTFFIAHLSHHMSRGVPHHILWLCNLANLFLAAGIFLRFPLFVRVSTMWLISGTPLWLLDMWITREAPVSTFLSHLGGAAVGLYALSKVRAERNMWIYAWLYGFSIQLFCRFFTPPQLNVNVAHNIYPGFDRVFTGYGTYWLFSALIAAIGLWSLGWVLSKVFPARPGESAPVWST